MNAVGPYLLFPTDMVFVVCWLFLSLVIGVMFRARRGWMRAGGALVAATPGYVLGRAALARRPDLDVWAGVALGAICFLLFLAARELSRLLPASVLRELDRMANKQTR